MGQVNASLGGPDGRPRSDQHQWPPINGSVGNPRSVSEDDILAENKKRDLKTMHCVKNRIDMLIEDCLNIKQVPTERKPDVHDKNKDVEIKTENETTISAQNDRKEITLDESTKEIERDNHENKDKPSSASSDSEKHEKNVEGAEKHSNEATPEKAPENSQIDGSGKAPGSPKEQVEDKPDVTKKKTITTFQKFIDEVFDQSLHALKGEKDTSSSNFLKLCSDSLKTDKEPPKTTQVGDTDKPKQEETIPKVESAVEVKNEEKPKRGLASDKEITLKDHIEKFLEASFKEENAEMSTTSAPKSLNMHMLVNDMITRGLKESSTDPTPSIDDQFNIQGKTEQQKDTFHVDSPKRNGMQTGYFRHKAGTIDGPNERKGMPHGPHYFTDKRHNVKNMHINSVTYTNSAYLQGVSNTNSREKFPVTDKESRPLNGPGKHDPFDPRFADPKFQDNRIDIVPLEVNAHTKRDIPQDKHTIPKMDPSGPMPGAAPGLYPSMSPYPVASGSPYPIGSRGSPSAQSGTDRFGSIGRPGMHSGHHPDCKCPSCSPHPSHSHHREQNIEYQRHQRSPNYTAHHFSPSDRAGMSPMAGSNIFHNDQSAVLVRPPHSSTVPLGQHLYPQTMPKPNQPHTQIPAQLERSMWSSSSSPAMDHINNLNVNARHPSNFGDFANQGVYLGGRRVDNFTPPVSSNKHSRSAPEEHDLPKKAVERSSHAARPSPLLSREHLVNSQQQGVRVYTDNDGSKASKQPVERAETESAPLDLTVKKVHQDSGHSRQSISSGPLQSLQTSQTKLSPKLTFIKHLENSVDKYCQELIAPPSPTVTSKPMKPQVGRRSVSPNERRSPMVGYVPSPHGISPQGLYPTMLQSHSLPSPHFSGGITTGQPLVDKSQSVYQQNPADMFGIGNMQTLTSVQQMQQSQQAMIQSQSGFMGPGLGQANFDPTGKRSMNNVSKHEPIQNIIGNHDSNDILYLYCKVCASTYGSLYGFRKHFRNQHGFEPRPEHTIVHTISGTKSALHIPAALPIEAIRQADRQVAPVTLAGHLEQRSANSSEDHVVYTHDESSRASDSPQYTDRGQSKADNSAKDQMDKGACETKCLECPECGKTFQLNDFGSYKRHCRQHSHTKPFGCTDCQRSFMDHKGLREHYKLHTKESQLMDGNKSDSSSSLDVVNFSCNKCDSSFFSSAQLDNHIESVHQRMSRSSGDSDKHVSETNKPVRTSFAQKSLSPNSVVMLPEMAQRISTESIVKQAAESMTAQVCPDSSWDKADKKVPVTQAISSDSNNDSGYLSSASSMVSQPHDDGPGTQTDNTDSKSGKGEPEKTESNEENYEVFYKHKKFFHPRKRENSVSCNSNDATPSKVSKSAEVSASSVGNTPVTSSTVYTSDMSCDSQFVDTKVPDTGTAEEAEADTNKPDVSEKSAPDLEDQTSKTTEARHNLPFVWDRTTRRKTK